jgi:RNA-binding protein
MSKDKKISKKIPKKKPTKQRALSGKQARYLRGLGHSLSAIVTIGKGGISETTITAVEDVLTARELIKVKLLNTCPLDRNDAAETLKKKTGAAVAQILGKTILLFRANKNRKSDDIIKLP